MKVLRIVKYTLNLKVFVPSNPYPLEKYENFNVSHVRTMIPYLKWIHSKIMSSFLSFGISRRLFYALASRVGSSWLWGMKVHPLPSPLYPWGSILFPRSARLGSSSEFLKQRDHSGCPMNLIVDKDRINLLLAISRELDCSYDCRFDAFVATQRWYFAIETLHRQFIRLLEKNSYR